MHDGGTYHYVNTVRSNHVDDVLQPEGWACRVAVTTRRSLKLYDSGVQPRIIPYIACPWQGKYVWLPPMLQQRFRLRLDPPGPLSEERLWPVGRPGIPARPGRRGASCRRAVRVHRAVRFYTVDLDGRLGQHLATRSTAGDTVLRLDALVDQMHLWRRACDVAVVLSICVDDDAEEALTEPLNDGGWRCPIEPRTSPQPLNSHARECCRLYRGNVLTVIGLVHDRQRMCLYYAVGAEGDAAADPGEGIWQAASECVRSSVPQNAEFFTEPAFRIMSDAWLPMDFLRPSSPAPWIPPGFRTPMCPVRGTHRWNLLAAQQAQDEESVWSVIDTTHSWLMADTYVAGRSGDCLRLVPLDGGSGALEMAVHCGARGLLFDGGGGTAESPSFRDPWATVTVVWPPAGGRDGRPNSVLLRIQWHHERQQREPQAEVMLVRRCGGDGSLAVEHPHPPRPLGDHTVRSLPAAINAGGYGAGWFSASQLAQLATGLRKMDGELPLTLYTAGLAPEQREAVGRIHGGSTTPPSVHVARSFETRGGANLEVRGLLHDMAYVLWQPFRWQMRIAYGPPNWCIWMLERPDRLLHVADHRGSFLVAVAYADADDTPDEPWQRCALFFVLHHDVTDDELRLCVWETEAGRHVFGDAPARTDMRQHCARKRDEVGAVLAFVTAALRHARVRTPAHGGEEYVATALARQGFTLTTDTARWPVRTAPVDTEDEDVVCQQCLIVEAVTRGACGHRFCAQCEMCLHRCGLCNRAIDIAQHEPVRTSHRTSWHELPRPAHRPLRRRTTPSCATQ